MKGSGRTSRSIFPTIEEREEPDDTRFVRPMQALLPTFVTEAGGFRMHVPLARHRVGRSKKLCTEEP
jgi:hypothetical protein